MNKRRHPRYSSDIPIAVSLQEVVASESQYMNNISEGGLSFNSMVALDLGTLIRIRIPVSKPLFETGGKVVWCNKMRFQYVIGVEFINQDEQFKRRMVEMVRRIEEYRATVLRQEGRTLTGQEAALEWLARVAGDLTGSNIVPRS